LVFEFLRKLAATTKGATAIEYALIIALIVIAAMAALMSLAGTTIDMWDNVAANVLAH
jgi:pilus assembly protein Flp/PilA